jgi:hypothetical protein
MRRTRNVIPTLADRKTLTVLYTPHRDSITCSVSHTADVETINQLVPNLMQSVPCDGSYGSYDFLSQLWQSMWHRRNEHFVFYVAPQEEVWNEVCRPRQPSAPHVTGSCTTD